MARAPGGDFGAGPLPPSAAAATPALLLVVGDDGDLDLDLDLQPGPEREESTAYSLGVDRTPHMQNILALSLSTAETVFPHALSQVTRHIIMSPDGLTYLRPGERFLWCGLGPGGIQGSTSPCSP